MDSSNAATIPFEGVTPILRVRNLQDSLDYYVSVLGFELDWQNRGIMASVSRDRCSIFLCEGDQGNSGAWVWIGVGNIELLFEAYRRRGAKIRHPPTNYAWAYEMQVEDPDGNVLRFGSEPKRDEPFGEWLDMNGRRWLKTPDGEWTQVEI